MKDSKAYTPNTHHSQSDRTTCLSAFAWLRSQAARCPPRSREKVGTMSCPASSKSLPSLPHCECCHDQLSDVELCSRSVAVV